MADIELDIALNSEGALQSINQLEAAAADLKAELSNATDPNEVIRFAKELRKVEDSLNDMNREIKKVQAGGSFEKINIEIREMGDNLSNFRFDEVTAGLNRMSKTVSTMNFGTITTGAKDMGKGFLNLGRSINTATGGLLGYVAAAAAVAAVLGVVLNSMGLLTPILKTVNKLVDNSTKLFEKWSDAMNLSSYGLNRSLEKSAKQVESLNNEMTQAERNLTMSFQQASNNQKRLLAQEEAYGEERIKQQNEIKAKLLKLETEYYQSLQIQAQTELSQLQGISTTAIGKMAARIIQDDATLVLKNVSEEITAAFNSQNEVLIRNLKTTYGVLDDTAIDFLVNLSKRTGELNSKNKELGQSILNSLNAFFIEGIGYVKDYEEFVKESRERILEDIEKNTERQRELSLELKEISIKNDTDRFDYEKAQINNNFTLRKDAIQKEIDLLNKRAQKEQENALNTLNFTKSLGKSAQNALDNLNKQAQNFSGDIKKAWEADAKMIKDLIATIMGQDISLGDFANITSGDLDVSDLPIGEQMKAFSPTKGKEMQDFMTKLNKQAKAITDNQALLKRLESYAQGTEKSTENMSEVIKGLQSLFGQIDFSEASKNYDSILKLIKVLENQVITLDGLQKSSIDNLTDEYKKGEEAKRAAFQDTIDEYNLSEEAKLRKQQQRDIKAATDSFNALKQEQTSRQNLIKEYSDSIDEDKKAKAEEIKKTEEEITKTTKAEEKAKLEEKLKTLKAEKELLDKGKTDQQIQLDSIKEEYTIYEGFIKDKTKELEDYKVNRAKETSEQIIALQKEQANSFKASLDFQQQSLDVFSLFRNANIQKAYLVARKALEDEATDYKKTLDDKGDILQKAQTENKNEVAKLEKELTQATEDEDKKRIQNNLDAAEKTLKQTKDAIDSNAKAYTDYVNEVSDAEKKLQAERDALIASGLTNLNKSFQTYADAIKQISDETLSIVGNYYSVLQGFAEARQMRDADILENDKQAELRALDETTQQKYDANAENQDAISRITEVAARERELIERRYQKKLDEQGEKGFKRNQQLAIAQASIQGLMGVVNALSAPSIFPSPFDFIVKGANAALVSAATIANIAKIKAVTYKGGGAQGALAPLSPETSAGGSGGDSGTGGQPNFQFFGQQISGNNLGATGPRQGQNTNITVDVKISESEITNTQKRIIKMANNAEL